MYEWECHLVFHCTNMKRSISAQINRVHVGSVGYQKIEMLHSSILADLSCEFMKMINKNLTKIIRSSNNFHLVNFRISFGICNAENGVIFEKLLDAFRGCVMTYSCVERGQPVEISVIWGGTKV